MGRKRGQKADWATNPNTGKPIEGLYQTTYKSGPYRGKIKAYYYKNKDGKHITCGSDFFKALQKFTIYKKENNITIKAPKITEFEINLPEVIDYPDALGKNIFNAIEQFHKGHISAYEADVTDQWWATAEKIIKSNLAYSALMLNIPELAYLHKITPPSKSKTLDEIWDIYIEHLEIEGKSVENTKKITKPAWKEFNQIVGKKYIRDIEHEDIANYNKTIHKQSRKESIKNRYAYVSNRYKSIKAVTNKAKDKLKDKSDIRQLIEHLDQLTNVSSNEQKKLMFGRKNTILSAKELKTLLEKANDDILIKCAILLGLNCCIRWSDFITITKDMIDFEMKEYRAFRSKNGIFQAAKLWDETVESVTSYMDESPNNSEYIFLTKYNNIWNRKDLERRFNKIRTKAKMEWLTQSKFRKMTATKASQLRFPSTTIAYKSLMGRAIPGADANYIYQMPSDTEELVQLLHDYYFSEKQKT